MKISLRKIIFAICFSGLMLIFFAMPFSVSYAAINKQINYQGKLTDSSNVAVTNGTYNMEFALYTVSSGGTAIWTEDRIQTNRVTITSGLFSVMLGEVATLAGVDFNQTLYLGVNIGGTTNTPTPTWDGEMTPRKKLGAVPAAMVADNANTVTGLSVTSGKILTVSDSSTIATNAITLAGGEVLTFSATNALSLLTTGATSVTFPTSGTLYGTATGSITSANVSGSVSDETGSGALVFANSPTFVTPALGTPSSGVATNLTGTASGLTAGNVITNANLTGAVTSSGNATSLGSFSSANLSGALTDETGSGTAVFGTSPTFITSITSPKVIGGTGTTDDLFLQTTSGVGASGADMHFLVGNNGATEALTILNNGNVGIRTTAPGELLSLGLAGTTKGVLSLSGNTSGKIIIQPAAAAGTYTLTLPTDDGTPSQVLTTDGSGILSWTTPTSGGTPGGSDTYVQFNDSGAFGAEAVFNYDKTTDLLSVPNITISGYTTMNNADVNNIDGTQAGFDTINAATSLTAGEVDVGSSVRPVTGVIGLSTTTVGDLTHPFTSVYIGNAATNNIQLSGVATGSRTITLPDVSGTLYTTATSSITSSQILTSLSDETGSGALVFSNSPAFTTPNIGSATGSITGNAATATALQNARTIGGVSFNGTANITVASATGGFTVSGGNLDISTNNIVTDTTTGTKIGTATTQKIGFFNSTPVVKPTGDVATALSNLGLIASPTITATTNANLSGPITSVGNATSIASQTGTGTKFVVDTSPTLVTPNIGAATATTVNGLTITSNGTNTLNIAAGKTLIASNSLTLAGTDGTTMTFPSTSATIARTDAANTFTGHQTIEGVTSTGATGTGKFVFDTSPTIATPTFTTSVILPATLDITGAATTLKLKSNTASALVINDGTNAYETIDTRTATSAVSALTWTPGTAPTIASGASTYYTAATLTPGTYTFTGTTDTTSTGTTAPSGLLINQPTIAGNGTRTIAQTSNLLINGPTRASSSSGTETITNTYGLNILAGSALNGSGGAVTNGYGLSVNAPTGAGTNYAAIFQGGNVGLGTTAPVDPISIGTAINASATHAMFNLSNTALVGGSTGGTYIGTNPASFTGNFFDFQLGGLSAGRLSANGVLTAHTGQFTNALQVGASSSDSFINTTGHIQLGATAASFITISPDSLNQWHASPNNIQIDTAGIITVGDGGFVDNTQLKIDVTGHTTTLNEVVGTIALGDVDTATTGQVFTTDIANGNFTFMSGSVGIGTTVPGALLDVTGTIRQMGGVNCALSSNASGDIICTSDANLKQNITPFTNGLSAIMGINPSYFQYKGESYTHAGFIAQNVQSVIPEATPLQNNGYLGLDTNAILATTVNAIKELNLNLEGISGTITPLESSPSESFVTSFFANIETKIGAWLADAGNGISNIFAKQINTNTLCVSDNSGAKTCITKDQLDALLSHTATPNQPAPDTGQDSGGSSPSPAPDQNPSPEPTPEPEVTPDPGSTPEGAPASEAMPEPPAEVTP